MLPIFQVAAGKVILSILLYVWIISANWNYLTQSLIRNIGFLIWYIYMLVLLMLGIWEYGFLGPVAFFIDIPLFFLGSIIFSYYYLKKNYRLLAKGCIAALSSILIGSINSLVKLTQYPSASRVLATGTLETQEYALMGIGGYGYVYGSIIVMISVIYLLKNKNLSRNMKVFLFILYIVNFIFIIKASYAIAIMFTILFSAISLFNFKKVIWFFFVFGTLIIVFKEHVGYLLMFLADHLPQGAQGQVASGKIMDLAQGLISNNFGPETVYRYQLYMQSVQSFFYNPIVGLTLSSNPNYSIGNHSAWLDLLGAFGLIGSLPVFIFFFIKFKQMNKALVYSHYVNYVGLYVLLLGLINSVIISYEFGFTLFFVVPSIPFIINNADNYNKLKYQLNKRIR